jgi:uncharacterized protein DUF3850
MKTVERECGKTHRLKTWVDVFAETWKGLKTFEFRLNDRDFQVGDCLILEEFEHVGENYTGRSINEIVTSISHGPEWGIPKGYCVMSTTPIELCEGGYGNSVPTKNLE